MASTFDDDELSMSLSGPAADRRNQRPARPSNASSQQAGSQIAKVPGDRRINQRIGQYDLKRTLGEGSFGKVKLATHRVTGQEVALKIITRKKLISKDMAGRVEREIQYLQLLRHPHIIKLYTVITTPTDIIMVLEYAGNELFDYLVKHGKMAETKARRFFQQIVCAVEYCHRHKIVHRDLKPENLLLDAQLNVKIADFGLSNIMTDGNFLKTSCGSPNYAAPEVISGKLYAGPEVDVWSCGVILYVLLVGRLPFDDEFIPSLFKKISSGTYSTPPFVSSGARHIIHKMLKVNAIQRITIQEIRQDPWFNEDLEEYLKQPVEEFFDTGVDPNKAIDPRKLAPGKPAAVQEQIHESVVGKLEKTIGYSKNEVQDALSQEQPNAIKDAYLIVRENQIMTTNARLTTAQNQLPFLATSPPAWDPNMLPTPQPITSPLAEAAQSQLDSLTTSFDAQQLHEAHVNPDTTSAVNKHTASSGEAVPTGTASANTAPGNQHEKPYVSKIGILTSSLPFYHNQIMKERNETGPRGYPQAQGEPLEPAEAEILSKHSLEVGSYEQSSEEQAETARRLKPHSRSTIQIQSITADAPKGVIIATPTKPPKGQRTKWQFGIRSKNEPIDAVSCLYKALVSMGDCQWRVAPPKQKAKKDPHDGTPYPVNVEGATHLTTAESTLSESPEKDKHNLRGERPSQISPADLAVDGAKDSNEIDHGDNAYDDTSEDENDSDIDINVMPDGYLPKDPWVIHVRWEKRGMAPLGVANTNSARSSHIDLSSNDGFGRRGSVALGSLSSAAGSSTSVTATEPATDYEGTACFVYMDLQIYVMEPGVYLVDFKCAGYEAIVAENTFKNKKGEEITEFIGSGHRVADKDVTSPQPFLDLANKLVIHLALANKG